MMWTDNTPNGAVDWDPKSPATLLVPAVLTNRDCDDDNGQNIILNYILSDSGVGCNTFESSAIMNLLDARDAYFEMKKSRNDIGDQRAILQLSKEYRKSLADCIDEWSDDLRKKEEGKEKELQAQEQEESDVALELLRITYAVTQLSETFLLLPSTMQEHNIGVGMRESTYYEDTWNLPGAVTADTVRYLRLHHLGDAEDQFDEVFIEELKNLWQPDQYNGNGEEYWSLIEAYIIRGCLEDAWATLSHHSIVRRFIEEMKMHEDDDNVVSDYKAASLAEDREGFRALEHVLLSAPIPGTRNNDSDEGFDENSTTEGNDRNSDGQNEENVLNSFVVEEEFIDGVPTSAYCLWETSRKGRRTGDYPANFEPHAAYQVYQYWKEAIDIPALQRLRRRIPQLNKLLELLCGNFRNVKFNSWQEEFCAELLYKTPNIRLVDMHVKAKILMEKFGKKDTADPKKMNDIVLTVMKGNAGQVINVMHQLGGGSGAALPAIMMYLLSQLLGDANVLTNPSDVYNLESELLIEASSAIRSSLATEGYHDLGTRLAVRLLLPHIEIDSDLRITANLTDTLEHHSPRSDAEAKGLLSLCRQLIERKNVRVLDGCTSICIARYLYYISEHRPGGAVYWLLTGIELESLVLCEGSKRSGAWQRALSSGICYRRLVTYFTEISRSLLKTLLGEEKGASLFHARAKEMVAAQEESNIASFVPAVKVLENVIVIASGIAERKDESIVANSIISCLEDRPNDEDDGAVSSLARSLHWDLLRLATAIIEGDAKRAEMQDKKKSVSSFDVKGMGILLSVFTIETKVGELKDQNELKTSPEELYRTRLILAEGLKRAFVAENSMKKSAASRRSNKTSAVGIYGANFARHSREEQERAVMMMLEY